MAQHKHPPFYWFAAGFVYGVAFILGIVLSLWGPP